MATAASAGVSARVSRGKVGMWMFLATDAMGFGGLLIAYAVLRVRADAWPDPAERLAIGPAAAMTFALLTSSLTMSLAVRAARGGRMRARAGWLAVTAALGLAFLGGQALEYRHLLGGPDGMGLARDLFASTFYVITGFHGAHVAAAVVLAATALAARGPTGRALEVVALLWHFVDLAWIPIFTFVYLLPAAAH
jgi:heme/copper-type cytochrome/quinol oxidase subunit 3